MKALFVAPLPFVPASGSSAPLAATSVANLNLDRPGLVWRGATNAVIVIDLGAEAVEYDTIAVIGSNLRASDMVRVQTGAAPDVMNGYDSGYVPAFVGSKPRRLSTKTIVRLPNTRGERYVRISFNATGNPDNFVRAQRIVIGKAVSTLGIKFGAKMNFEDRSIITTGEGYTSIDRLDVLFSWEITTTAITDQAWREQWFPLLMEVGSSSGLLFIRDESAPTTWQTDAIYGRISSKAYGEAEAYNWWTFAGTILTWAP